MKTFIIAALLTISTGAFAGDYLGEDYDDILQSVVANYLAFDEESYKLTDDMKHNISNYLAFDEEAYPDIYAGSIFEGVRYVVD